MAGKMEQVKRRLAHYRRTVCERLKKEVPALREVMPHAGPFKPDEIVRRHTILLPAAVVVFLHMRKIRFNNVGQLIGPVTMVVPVITKDPMVKQGFEPAINLAEEVADAIQFNTWNLDYCAAAIVREIEPLYSEAIDKLGVAITMVTFSQEVTIGRNRHFEDEKKHEHLFGFHPNVPQGVAGREQDEDWVDL